MLKRVVNLLIIVFIVSMSFSVFSFTAEADDVSGDITFNTNWSIDKTVIGDVTVKPGITLTIDPGITVEFDSGMNLYVEGTLNAIGTPASKIIFTTSNTGSPQKGDWGSINFKAFSTGKIQNATIEYATSGIYTFMASPTIRDSLIRNNKIYGIECHNYSAPSIVNNVITDNNDCGIYLFNHSTALIKDNDVLNTGLNYGIYAVSSNAIIEHNLVKNNNLAGISCGVLYNVGVCNATINNNTVTQNTIDGMYFLTAHPRLYNNIVTYNGESGIVPSQSSRARIDYNTIQHNGKHGIDSVSVLANGRPTIINNNISYNNLHGINCFMSSHPTISNNEIQFNNGTGINIDGASPRINTNNKIAYNKQHGISCNFSSRARITNNNIISGNDWNGIYVNNSNPTIENNKITYNDWSGVWLQESSNVRLVGNTINQNLKNGLSSSYNSKAEIETTLINNNGDFGIVCIASALDITNSEVKNNGNDGIYLFSASITVINDTQINSNTGDGIFCKSSSPTVELSTILNNQANGVYADFYSRPQLINTSITSTSGLDYKVTGNSHPVSLNTTFTKNKVNIDPTSSLTVQWFLNLKVTNSSAGLISGAHVKLINLNSLEVANSRTDQNGTIYWVVATDYVESAGLQRTMYTPHDLSILRDGYQPYNSPLTMDQTKWLEIVLNHVPTRPSNFVPVTTHNLTPELKWSPSIEEDLDPVTYHLSLFEGTDNTSTILVDNAILTTPSYKIVAPLILEYGKSYFVELYADDGKGGISPKLLQIFEVVNTRPQTPTLELLPVGPKTYDKLVCNITAPSIDDDIEPVDLIFYTYKWYKNGVLENGYTTSNVTATSNELPAVATTKNDVWKCEVTPWDGIELGVTAKVQVVIQNSAPGIVEPLEDFEIDEDTVDYTTIDLDKVFEDADNDSLLFRAERVATSGGYNIKVDIDEPTGRVTLQPNPNWHGKDIIIFYATDNDGEEIYEGVEITVRSVNDPPVLNHTANRSVYEHQWLYLNLDGYDDADPKDDLVYENDALDIIPGLRKDKNYFFDKNTGELSIETDTDMIGSYIITVGVSDGNENGTVIQQVEIVVLNYNDAPSAKITTPSTGTKINTTTPIDLSAQAADPDLEIASANEQLQYIWKSNISGILGNELTLKNVLLKKGSHKISFIVTDSGGLESKSEITIQVVQIVGPSDGPDIINGNGPGPSDNGGGGTDGEKSDEIDMTYIYLLVIVIIVLALILTLFVFKYSKARREVASMDPEPEPSPRPEMGAGPIMPLQQLPAAPSEDEDAAVPKPEVQTPAAPPPPPPPTPAPVAEPPAEIAPETTEAPEQPATITETALTAKLIATAPTSDMPTATPLPSPAKTGESAAATPPSDKTNVGGGGSSDD